MDFDLLRDREDFLSLLRTLLLDSLSLAKVKSRVDSAAEKCIDELYLNKDTFGTSHREVVLFQR